MATCLIIVNPVSRGALKRQRLDSAVAYARAAGWDVSVAATELPGHATSLARDAAARGVDVVIAHGGDGTVNEVANGLAGTRTALAVLPGGTANVWAKETRVSKKPLAAMRAIIGGERRRVDLGRAGERYFLLMAGVGLDGVVVRSVGERLKRWLRAVAYIVHGVLPVLTLKAWRVEMTIETAAGAPDGDAASGVYLDTPGVPDSREQSLYWLVVGNTRSYGGMVQITHRAAVDDGALDIVLVRRGGLLRIVADAVRLLLRRHDRSPNVLYARASALRINTAGIPVQADGEYAGETPMAFGVAPAALEVIVPSGLRSPLFSASAGQHFG